MDGLLLGFLQAVELCQDGVRYISRGVTGLFLKGKQDARLAVYLRVYGICVALYFNICDIRQINLAQAVHTHIDQYQVCQSIHGIDGISHLDEEGIISLTDITGRKLHILRHQKLADNISGQNGVQIRLIQRLGLGVGHGFLCRLQGCGTADHLHGSVGKLQRSQDLILVQCGKGIIDGHLSCIDLLLCRFDGGDTGGHLHLCPLQSLDGLRKILCTFQFDIIGFQLLAHILAHQGYLGIQLCQLILQRLFLYLCSGDPCGQFSHPGVVLFTGHPCGCFQLLIRQCGNLCKLLLQRLHFRYTGIQLLNAVLQLYRSIGDLGQIVNRLIQSLTCGLQIHQLTLHFRLAGIELDLLGIQHGLALTDLIRQLLLAVLQFLLAVFYLIFIILDLLGCVLEPVFDLIQDQLVQLVDLLLIQGNLDRLLHAAGCGNGSHALDTLQLGNDGIVHIGGNCSGIHVIHTNGRNHDGEHIRIDGQEHGGTHVVIEASGDLIQLLLQFDHGGIHIRGLLVFQDDGGYTVPGHGLDRLQIRCGGQRCLKL